jgi:starch phosphorylase
VTEVPLTDLRSRLTALSRNLWWSWHRELGEVFGAIDLDLWRRVNRNPVAFLADCDPKAISAHENNGHLLTAVIRAERALERYLGSHTHWASHYAPGLEAFPVAYFSPEFALHESLPVYSGGLGVLAGDHIKSCSDLGIRTAAVTLLYRQGYFTQEIDKDGQQMERYYELPTHRTALEEAKGKDGSPLTIEISLGSETIVVGIWTVDVGRCKLVLLDPRPTPGGQFEQALRLYGGDRRTRILQEVVLGIGGYRALIALGIRPGVLHLNEGHSAFAVLEAIAQRMHLTGMSFAEVAPEVAASVVFTTHTPVAAGHDYFEPELVLQYLGPLQRDLGISAGQLLGLGRVRSEDLYEEFCMTVLGLKLANRTNAVSSLHGHVSRRMWHKLWPERRLQEVPIGSVTNGAHVDTWISAEIAHLLSDALGVDWRAYQCRPDIWRKTDAIDVSELYAIKTALKRRLIEFIDRRSEARAKRLGIPFTASGLRPDRLTIAFSRRFAVYKRGGLLFDDFEKAKALLTNVERPVQIIYAGKAHPADKPGQAILRRLYEISQIPEMKGHVVVVDDYDMNVSRHLLEGADVWLNSPRRPLEACGTSGMKAVFNCTLNCSILDGWWDEAYDGENGFAYGDRLVHVDPAVHDKRDAESLIKVLTEEVVPCYYGHREEGVPVEWFRRVKRALRTLGWRYNSDRMVMDYARLAYVPASGTGTAHVIG